MWTSCPKKKIYLNQQVFDNANTILLIFVFKSKFLFIPITGDSDLFTTSIWTKFLNSKYYNLVSSTH